MRDPLWDEMCEIIKWHNKPQHCCMDTINRLWRKDPFVHSPKAIPILNRETLSVEVEQWPLERLMSFICQERITDLAPAETKVAVVVLRWSGLHYLIDGRRRINFWNREHNHGPHRVLVIHEADI